jgi:predicted dehydrogenase
MKPVRLITLDPGHFHAALVQKEAYPEVDRRAHVYAPLGPDLLAHLVRVAGFNARAERPTAWELEVHAGPDYLDRLLRERPGDVVVLAGRNRVKIDYIEAAVGAGLHVLADKPWVIDSADLPRLAAVLDAAERRGLVAYDIMTERHEITSILQRELVQDRAVFGEPVPGTADEAGVYMESVHYLIKQVAGAPLRRPAWFFDVGQQGEGLSDVGTHLVDLVPWVLYPAQPIDHASEIRLLSAKRWPTALTRAEFQRVTGEADFPPSLAAAVRGDALDYFCNTQVTYTLRGVRVKLDVLWGKEAEPGAGDTHLAVFRGTRSRVEIRQGPEERFRPELYVVPLAAGVADGVHARAAALQGRFPGVAVEVKNDRLQMTIPDRYRVGHEAHFAEVARQFLRYLREPQALPAWEKPNMLAKYHVTTQGVALARRS